MIALSRRFDLVPTIIRFLCCVPRQDAAERYFEGDGPGGNVVVGAGEGDGGNVNNASYNDFQVSLGQMGFLSGGQGPREMDAAAPSSR